MILKAKDFNARNLVGTVSVSYSAQDIKTEALEVTAENIGALSVELHTGISYSDGAPVLFLKLDRGEDEEPQMAELRPGMWIVALWEQLYVFKDFDFKTTFIFNSEAFVPNDPTVFIEDHSSSRMIRGDL